MIKLIEMMMMMIFTVIIIFLLLNFNNNRCRSDQIRLININEKNRSDKDDDDNNNNNNNNNNDDLLIESNDLKDFVRYNTEQDQIFVPFQFSSRKIRSTNNYDADYMKLKPSKKSLQNSLRRTSNRKQTTDKQTSINHNHNNSNNKTNYSYTFRNNIYNDFNDDDEDDDDNDAVDDDDLNDEHYDSVSNSKPILFRIGMFLNKKSDHHEIYQTVFRYAIKFFNTRKLNSNRMFDSGQNHQHHPQQDPFHHHHHQQQQQQQQQNTQKKQNFFHDGPSSMIAFSSMNRSNQNKQIVSSSQSQNNYFLSRKTLEPILSSRNVQMIPSISYIDLDDPYEVIQEFCLQLNHGTRAFIVPPLGLFASLETLRAYSKAYQLPMVLTSMAPFVPPLKSKPKLSSQTHSSSTSLSDSSTNSTVFNLFPDLTDCIVEMIKTYQWSSIIFLYNTDSGKFKSENFFS
ncbi:hypothetical protein SSS_06582 [Sarcoptes scabiei]|uniref:Receptor ligand binding region domain-containing protein n=1 Tax=Sarcoptes scabiei TaxID=52283 RepID=A0A834RE33_SARSC|nr:hypothetical protein SSS_06582 [Sarcoptes scabiei]